jgi:hypothetical protein
MNEMFKCRCGNMIAIASLTKSSSLVYAVQGGYFQELFGKPKVLCNKCRGSAAEVALKIW